MDQDLQPWNDLPDMIVSEYQMREPNEEIMLFEGAFELRVNSDTDTDTYSLEGKIFFSWFPEIGVKFYGESNGDQRYIPLALLGTNNSYELLVENTVFEKVRLVRTKQSDKIDIEGGVSGKAIFGDKSIPVDKVRFAVPNLRSFRGETVKYSNESGTKSSDRIIIENDEYLIRIDKSLDFRGQYEKLQQRGGYTTLYSGELEAKKKQINPDGLEEITFRLAYFLSFLNGRMTTPLFFQGIDGKEIKWTDFTRRFHIHQYKSVVTWPPKHTRIKGLNETWQKFNSLFDDENDKDFLTSAIWWYIEANLGSTLTESRIVTAQNCLELIYNWFIVEKQKLIVGRDSANISAANKVRLLIAQLRITTDIPQQLFHLQSFVNKDREIVDGVDAFVQIRNAVVHSQEKKRKKLLKIGHEIKEEALQLAIWYIELSLLYILNFKGKYYNRCSGASWAGDGEELVPWANN